MGKPTVLCAIDLDWERDDSASAEYRNPSMGGGAEATLRAADDAARWHQAALVLIHALPLQPGAPMSPAAVEQALLARERLTRLIVDGLTRAAERLGLRSAAELSVLVEDGPADEAIVGAARRLAAELVVLGATGGHPVRRLLLGSVTTAVVQRAPCSVLVVRAPSQRAPA